MSYGNQFLMRLESQELKSFKLLIDSFCKKDIYLNELGFLHWPYVTQREEGTRGEILKHTVCDWLEIKNNLGYFTIKILKRNTTNFFLSNSASVQSLFLI